MARKSFLQTVYNNSDNLFEEVQKFIDRGENLNRITKYSESALRVASNNGRFDVVKLLLESGADKAQLGWSDTFYEVVFGNLNSIKESINNNSDLEHRDFWERTPWLISIQVGDIEKSSILLNLGADRTATGRCGKQPLAYAIQHNNIEMLNWLVENEFDIESMDEFQSTPLIIASELGMTNCVKYLIEKGADIHKTNHIPERAIEVASNLDIVKLLIDQGDDINDISEETHALLVRAKVDGTPQVSQKEYEEGKHRTFGRSNPECAKNSFWLEMVRTGASAWNAKNKYGDTDFVDNPVWCYKRFGRSTTILPDGTIVEIAGEHEDYYDPDFCIYNDVTVFSPNGDIKIYTYPEEDFPPTDFHSATLIGDYIYIIGSLGYFDHRVSGYTPVYRLSISSFKIEKVETSGEMPGWLSRHKACVKSDSKIMIVGGEVYSFTNGKHDYHENTKCYQLCTITKSWKRLE